MKLDADPPTTLDVDIKGQLQNRRLVWPDTGMNLITMPNLGNIANARSTILIWLYQYTTGKFYFGGNQIGFMDEKDEFMFKLGFKYD